MTPQFFFCNPLRNFAADDTIVEADLDGELQETPFDHTINFGSASEVSQDVPSDVKRVIQEISVMLAYQLISISTEQHINSIRADPQFNDVSFCVSERMKYLAQILIGKDQFSPDDNISLD